MHSSKLLMGLVAAAATCAAVAAIDAPHTEASSHREAPAITEDPTIDCTDVYAFRSPDDPTKVTLIANYIPLQEPSGGPNYFNFSDTALYEIHIDNDGDAVEDITYQFQFTTTTKVDTTFLYNGPPTGTNVITYNGGTDTYDGLNVEQNYTVTKVVGDRRTGVATVLGTDELVFPCNVGDNTAGGVSNATPAALEAGATRTLSDGTRSFCGQRDDPFYVQLGRTFDLINIDPIFPAGRPADAGAVGDHLAGFNVHTIALQIDIDKVTKAGQIPTDINDPESVIGVWSTASRRQVRLNRTGGGDPVVGGAWVQVSRLGNPLVNEVVIPRRDKNKFNNSEPKDDTQFLSYVTDPELAAIFNALFAPAGLRTPGTPLNTVNTTNRQDLVQVFLTGLPGVNVNGATGEYLRLNLAVTPTPFAGQTREGALGHPNTTGMGGYAAVAAQLDGFPNGRRPADDVVDIALRVVADGLTGAAYPNTDLGDGVIQNDVAFLPAFPYLARPHSGHNRMKQN